MREADRRSTPEAQIKRRGDLTARTENCKFYFLARGGEGGRGLRPWGEVVTIGQQGGGGGEREEVDRCWGDGGREKTGT